MIDEAGMILEAMILEAGAVETLLVVGLFTCHASHLYQPDH